MNNTRPAKAISSQTIGNIGLYYVCHQLSLLGWNVMPTARNARGIDIVAYTQSGTRVLTIQVKSLSKRNAVPLGSKLDNLIADFVVIVDKVASDKPVCHVMTPAEVKKRDIPQTKGGITSHWLPPAAYEEFNGNLGRIGKGIG